VRKAEPIWLASYPRSGNTLLRTVLRHCFGLHSASIYPNDLGGNKALENYVGHREHGTDGRIHFAEDEIPLIKTHAPPRDNCPAIYVVRDGRAACISLWEFYDRNAPLETIIRGEHRFGTWSDHVLAWQPWSRPNTVLLKYEDITNNLPSVLEELSKFLGRAVLSSEIPPRDNVASVDGQWVRKRSEWAAKISAEELGLFDAINGNVMRKLGYPI